MKSPFPGMDPYLETHWLDVHASLANSARDSLNGQLPNDLIASVEERVAIETPTGSDHVYGPDVRIFEPPTERPTFVEEPAVGVIDAPYRLVVQMDPITERSVRIVEAGTERLITVIEFLSPTNKKGGGLQDFIDKRADLVAAGVNFVEVDLIRAGDWRALLRPHLIPREVVSLYRVTIRIARDHRAVYFYPIRLQDRLPSPVLPLREKDPEIRLELQSHIEHAYTSGRYDRRIDFGKPLDPPLFPEDAAWADQLLKTFAQSRANR
jgi:hypothetical protein